MTQSLNIAPPISTIQYKYHNFLELDWPINSEVELVITKTSGNWFGISNKKALGIVWGGVTRTSKKASILACHRSNPVPPNDGIDPDPAPRWFW